jgi:hypothetical protein
MLDFPTPIESVSHHSSMISMEEDLVLLFLKCLNDSYAMVHSQIFILQYYKVFCFLSIPVTSELSWQLTCIDEDGSSQKKNLIFFSSFTSQPLTIFFSNPNSTLHLYRYYQLSYNL